MTQDEAVIYRGKIVDLYRQTVTLPNGVVAEFEIVRHPGGAAVVALDAEGRVCLLRQYRHVADGWLWELPAGRREVGESPESTIRRELEEEAGLRAAQWESLGRVITSPGIFTEVVHLFRARDLTPVPAKAEAQEIIEVKWVPLSEALSWASTGEITDAKTVAALFRASRS